MRADRVAARPVLPVAIVGLHLTELPSHWRPSTNDRLLARPRGRVPHFDNIFANDPVELFQQRLMASECSTFDVNTNYDFGSADDQPQSNNALLFETDPQNRYQELRSNTSYRPRPTVSAPTVGT